MRDLYERLQPLGRILDLSAQGYTVWDCSPIDGPDGRVHLFVARWAHGEEADRPDAIWCSKGEIVHAIADRPDGPYEVVGTVIAGHGGDDHWDASGVINPKICRIGDHYALVYTGCTAQRHDTQRIGLLTAPTLNGPWTRANDGQPIVAPSADRCGFDGYLCNNPALLQHPDGDIWLYYKGRDVIGEQDGRYKAGGMRIGLATAPTLDGPFTKHPASPVIDFGDRWLEDPTVWHDGSSFWLLASDISVLDEHGGLLFRSDDGIHWGEPERGYPGASKLLGCKARLEEPNLLFRHGQPAYLFNVLGASPGDPAYSGHVCRIAPV